MKNRWLLTFLFVSLQIGCCQQGIGQSYLTAVGNPSFGVNVPIEDGFINVSNGNVHLEIPLASFAQRGSLSLNERIVYDSRIWQIIQNGGDYLWKPTNVPNSMDGWRVTAGNEVGTVTGPGAYSNYMQCPQNGKDMGAIMSDTYEGFTWTDPQGTAHLFNAITQRAFTPNICTEGGYLPAPDIPTASGYAIDGSGYGVQISNYETMTVYDPNGNEVYPNLQDSNGNYFSADANGNLIDTRGLTPVLKSTSGNSIYYDVLIPGGKRKRYTITTESIPVNTSFNQSGVKDFSGSLTSIASITLPDNTTYSFTYDSSGYGEIASMTWPTGGVISFGFENYEDSYQNYNRWLSSYTGGRGSLTFSPKVVTQCNVNNGVPVGCQEQTTLTDALGNATVYTFVLNGGAWNTQETSYSGSATSGTPVMSTATTYNFSNSCALIMCNGNAQWVTAGTTTTTLDDTGQNTQTVSTYAAPWLGKPSQVEQWDYFTGSTPPSKPTRISNYTYGWGVNGAGLLTYSNQTDGSGNILQQTTNTYDCGSSCMLQTSGAPSHNSVSGHRGNLTSVTRGLAANGGTVTTSSTFDDAGVPLTAVDANSNTASYLHDPTDTYVTSTTLPKINGISHITGATYDPSTGSILTMTDMNSQPTKYSYDSLGRLQTKTNADNGIITYSYPSATEQDITSTISSSVTAEVQSYVDSYGRAYQKVTSDPAGNDTVTKTYDADGRPSCITNAERATASPTDGQTCLSYDGAGRPTQQLNPDGTVVSVSRSGNTVTLTDEAGNKKKYQYDAFGDLTEVWEPNSSGALSWTTIYTYDATGNMLTATQNGVSGTDTPRVRTFTYDGLGRKLTEKSPELGNGSGGGTTTLTYDANSNVKTQVSAVGTVTYTYDALNRALTRAFGGVTQQYTYDVSSYYGFSSSNPIGRLVAMYNGVNAGEAYSYDPMGRITAQAVCNPTSACPSSTLQFTAKYDYAGELVQLTYPDGRKLTQSFTPPSGSNAVPGQLQSVTYTGWNGTSENTSYVSNFAYNAIGNATSLQMGNGVTSASQFNSRSSITLLSYTGPSKNLIWSSEFVWAAKPQNLLQMDDLVHSTALLFSYDQVNRLGSVQGGGTTGVTSASGNITISGVEKSTTNPITCPHGVTCGPGVTVYDAGTVSATAGPTTESVLFGEDSTPATLASALAAAFNNDSNSALTATASGAVVTLTSKSKGTITDYPLSVSVVDRGLFPNAPSFSEAASGPTLTGGTSSGTGEIQQTFSYDAFGNLKQAGSFNFSQSYNANNQISSGGYSYDAAGRLSADGLGNTFSFDVPGHLASSGGNAAATYVYDAADRRVEKSSGADTKEYLYFGGKLMTIYQPGTSSWLDLIYANGSVLAEVAGTPTATPNFRVNDNLESVVGLLNGSGGLTGSGQYAPFGEQISNTTGDMFGFTGLESDAAETSLNYAGARYFSPVAGRWVSPDPDSGSYDWSNPQTLNRYTYATNNPLGFRDPTGTDPDKPDCITMFIPALSTGQEVVVAAAIAACIVEALITALIHFLESLIPWPSNFDGSIQPRPTASGNVWDENLGLPAGMHPHPPGIAALLGLPTGDGCDFGPCGVGSGSTFLEGQSSNPDTAVTVPPDVLAWGQRQTKSNHWFTYAYGRFCGPGGRGTPMDDADSLCLLHDYCYWKNHLNAIDNFIGTGDMEGKRDVALQKCNQALCDGLKKLNTRFEITWWFSNTGIQACQ